MRIPNEYTTTLKRLVDGGRPVPAEIQARLAERPRCPLAQYLLGCQELDRGRPASAARAFMIAYHADPQLESAALLVFVGLNWSTAPGRPLLDIVRETLAEYRRLDFDRTARERDLLDALACNAPPLRGDVDAASHLWRLPIPRLRESLRGAADGSVEHYAVTA